MKKAEKKDRTTTDSKRKKKIFRSGAVLLLVTILLIGFTYAWFINRNDIATLMEIREPSDIAILGPDGQPMESLNLSSDQKNGGTVTIRKVFCVQSAENYKLEIAHTTNLKGLEFKLYPATKNADGTVTDGGITFSYNDKTPIAGKYINVQSQTSTSGYKYADSTQHAQNYSQYSKVQEHAEPAYWLADSTQEAKNSSETETKKEKTYYNNYYVCEITWTEESKETDIFYILAKNA